MPKDYFGEHVAERYDESAADMFDPATVDPVVDFLAELASDGSALELGIGTGRIALPLGPTRHPRTRHRSVRGDGCPAAGEAGRRSDRCDDRGLRHDYRRGTVLGRLPGLQHDQNLTSQDEQVACFQNVAAHLQPGGCFVIEVGVPDLQRLPPGETVRPFTVTPERLGFDEYDIAGQGLISHHYWMDDGRLETVSMPFRYVWPAELDLMARIAGMSLRERWSGWNREPFTSESRQHVSVWEKKRSP